MFYLIRYCFVEIDLGRQSVMNCWISWAQLYTMILRQEQLGNDVFFFLALQIILLKRCEIVMRNGPVVLPAWISVWANLNYSILMRWSKCFDILGESDENVFRTCKCLVIIKKKNLLPYLAIVFIWGVHCLPQVWYGFNVWIWNVLSGFLLDDWWINVWQIMKVTAVYNRNLDNSWAHKYMHVSWWT